MDRLLHTFREIWVWDSEFVIVPGWHVTPVCMAGVEVRSGASVTATFDHPGQLITNPLPFGPDVLHVLFSATADLGFSLAAGWGLPYNVLDLWVERRNLTNNITDRQRNEIATDLVSTCHDYGIFDTISFEAKEANRMRIAQGFPFTGEEMHHILDYCKGDVNMTRTLLDRMIGQIGDIEQALHRGRCMKAVACMEWNGVPVNVAKLEQLKRNTKAVRRSVVRNFEDEYQAGIHSWDRHGDPHFSNKGYTDWVRRMGFDEETWLFNGDRASADDKLVLEPMSLLYSERMPVIEEYRQLRKFLTLAKSEFKFPVGPDGRNRSGMRPFEARSSRSQPKTSENIPNATKALRSLLAPHVGEVLMHRDWSNTEYGIAAALAHDNKRWDHYLHRDAYLVKAADYGFCDYTATKATHRVLRNKFKPVVLAGQYGQTPEGLAKVLGISVGQAKLYQEREARLYPKYQGWLAIIAENRAFDGYVETECGWKLWVPKRPSAHDIRTAMNLPMQGNCAEIMRIACCLATERGIDLGATVHDALFYTAPSDSWRDVDAAMKQCMDEACQVILGDEYVLKSDRDVVLYDAYGYRYDSQHNVDYGHYQHEDGHKMWRKIEAALAQVESENQVVLVE
ncbi:MAG: DNA polymerase [Terriglobales bacterium]